MNAPMNNHLVRHESAMQAMAVPKNLDHLYEMVERAYKAALVPSSFKSVEAAFLAAQKGAEFGLLPFQSLSGFYVIGNVAHPWGTCMRGVVQASPLYEGEMEGCIEGLAELEYMAKEPNEYKEGSLDHALFRELQRALKRRLARVQGAKLPAGSYFCGYSVVKREGQEPYCVLFDTFEAHRAGLTTKGDNWTKFPHRMYQHRAGTFARRDRFAAAMIGLESTVEEMQDVIEVQAVEVTRPPAGTAPMAPMSTGQVLDVLASAGRPAPITVREAAPSYTAPPSSAAPSPPEPEAGFVPVGEPGAAEAEDKAVPAPKPSESPKASKNTGTAALKAASDKLKAAVTDKAQMDAIVSEARREAGVPDYVARMSNATDEQRQRVADLILEALARLAAEKTNEAAPFNDPDPTDF